MPGAPHTPPVYAAEAAAGLVKAFEYTSENRLKTVRADKGDKGAVANFTKVLEVTYGNGSGNTRTHLPNKIERFRVAGSSAANDVETVEYTYSFHTQNAIEWMEVEAEAELEAENGPDALVKLAQHDNIDLIFTDVVMPGGLTGFELAEKACELRPSVKVVFATGYADDALAGRAAFPHIDWILAKPYEEAELAEKIHAALAGTAKPFSGGQSAA